MKTLFAATALTALATTAAAQDMQDVTIGGGLSNFGLAVQGEFDVAPDIKARAIVMGGLTLDDTFELDEDEVDGEAQFGGFALVGDYYPLQNAWRITGGLFLSNTEISGTVTGDQVYEGEVAFKNNVAPLIATGFSAPINEQWSFYGDLGVIISPLEVSSDSTDTDVQADIDELNSDLEDVPVFPYIAVGVSYQF